MENLKLSAICLPIALLLGSTLTISLSAIAVSDIGDRNPIERQLIISGTCEKCSSESGDVCCPAG